MIATTATKFAHLTSEYLRSCGKKRREKKEEERRRKRKEEGRKKKEEKRREGEEGEKKKNKTKSHSNTCSAKTKDYSLWHCFWASFVFVSTTTKIQGRKTSGSFRCTSTNARPLKSLKHFEFQLN